MSDLILIVYATWTGATRQVAAAIGEVLSAGAWEVDVMRAKKAGDISPYAAVVVGTSVHASRLPGEIRRFVGRHADALARVPVAYFVVCYTMNEDTPENRRVATSYLDPFAKLAHEVEPVDVGLFGGAVLIDTEEYRKLFPLLKIPLGAMAKEPGDRRNWDAIHAWAEGLGEKLAAASSA